MTAAEPEEQWTQMKNTQQETMAEVVGLSTRKHQDWFDEGDKEIQELIEKKRSCHKHLLAKTDDQTVKAAYKTVCSTLQTKLRTMQNNWWTGLGGCGHERVRGNDTQIDQRTHTKESQVACVSESVEVLRSLKLYMVAQSRGRISHHRSHGGERRR